MVYADTDSLDDSTRYTLLSRITAKGKIVAEFRGAVFNSGGLMSERHSWLPESLWDLHTPGNQYELTLTLEHAGSRKPLDVSFTERFGFREFWIDGKDFYLNGSRIFLSAVPLDNAQIGAALANYKAAVESLQRLKSIGVNFVYTHNYGCQPGDHLSFAEILRAADDVGMLVALSQPHFSHYDWQAADADANNGYAHHAEFYVRQAQNHPSVVAYSMSHNACGYSEDMNPDMIDGRTDPRKSPGELNNVARALRAETIVKRFDPARIIYHHAGGNIGAMHTINFYPNFVPIQEMSDWFEHWATTGVKPAFTCEYGAPFSWDWAMYRGWYNGERSFGSARVPWDFCLSEWNAQFLGDRAFQTSDYEKNNLRFEARQLAAGKVWNRWDYQYDLNSKLFDERYPVIAQYLTDNWRAFRTWGLSAISAWEHGMYWKLRDGVDRGRKELIVDWNRLQRPGFSPDYTAQRYERMDLAYEPSDWKPTPAAEALLRNNGPLLAYIAGKPGAFTSKDHLFYPGETVEKQLVVVNNSREGVNCLCIWSLNLPQPLDGSRLTTVVTGDQVRHPLKLKLPADTPPGQYRLRARFEFTDGIAQEDSFTLTVLPRPSDLSVTTRTALFDPRGETEAWLKTNGIPFTPVSATADLTPFDLLIIGKAALSVDGVAPDVTRIRDGLRVLVFEQTADVLEKRLGFRIAEYGLRQVFPRIPDHPVLDGLSTDALDDWRGEATLNPPRLKYESRPRYGPTVRWCDIEVPHLWRCGNRGNVASVLIEKPARGDFLPIVDGGFSLQYNPLMEYRDGRGMILFCQMDVTGRTEPDPAAETLTRSLLRYLANWKPAPQHRAMYVGQVRGKLHLESIGITPEAYDPAKLSPNHVLILGSGSGDRLRADNASLAAWLTAGGHLVTIGLSEQDLQTLPIKVATRKAEHIAAYFDPQPLDSPFAGIGPADVHNRDPKELPLVSGGATTLGNGVLAHAENGGVSLCQLAPWDFSNSKQLNHRKTFRRSSFLVTRLLANMGVAAPTPLLDRLHQPVDASRQERRWLDGLYLDVPQEWDEPYRFFRW
jgi:beta-galactosidase